MNVYELVPEDGQKSFYGKARVHLEPNGAAVLVSYTTPVIRRNADGTLSRLWSGWSATTGRHIRAFCGLNKKEWDALPVDGGASFSSAGRTLTNAESYRAMMGRRYAG